MTPENDGRFGKIFIVFYIDHNVGFKCIKFIVITEYITNIYFNIKHFLSCLAIDLDVMFL